MKIKLDQRMNPQNPNVPGKWYAVPVQGEKITTDELNRQIAELSTASAADADAVLDTVGLVMTDGLKRGRPIYLRNIGTFRLGLHSEGVVNPNDFTLGHILGHHVIFTPDARLLDRLRGIHFEDTGTRGAEALRIDWLTDLVSGTSNDRLTPGGSVKLSGNRMKIGGDDPSVGLKLINVDTQAVHCVPMSSIPVNKSKEIIFIVPPELPAGRWQVRIVSQISASGKILKAPRGFTCEVILQSQ